MKQRLDNIDPIISVIMPVYNVETYIARAVSSVLNQTFLRFEFIIIDDGSMDKTCKIIRSFADPRIRFYERHHLGTVYQLNFGLEQARGRYIARQDGDDWSTPDRFQRQIEFLERHPEYGAVSSGMRVIDENGTEIGVLRYPDEPDMAKLMERCCIPHAPSMWHKAVSDHLGGYDEAFNKNCCEDYDFWLRVVEYYRIHVLNEILYIRRDHSRSSIRGTKQTYVPVFDELARDKARRRKGHSKQHLQERRTLQGFVAGRRI